MAQKQERKFLRGSKGKKVDVEKTSTEQREQANERKK